MTPGVDQETVDGMSLIKIGSPFTVERAFDTIPGCRS
jgi:hypothetical protein